MVLETRERIMATGKKGKNEKRESQTEPGGATTFEALVEKNDEPLRMTKRELPEKKNWGEKCCPENKGKKVYQEGKI